LIAAPTTHAAGVQLVTMIEGGIPWGGVDDKKSSFCRAGVAERMGGGN
jgi:hypothetical protein